MASILEPAAPGEAAFTATKGVAPSPRKSSDQTIALHCSKPRPTAQLNPSMMALSTMDLVRAQNAIKVT